MENLLDMLIGALESTIKAALGDRPFPRNSVKWSMGRNGSTIFFCSCYAFIKLAMNAIRSMCSGNPQVVLWHRLPASMPARVPALQHKRAVPFFLSVCAVISATKNCFCGQSWPLNCL